MTSILRVFFVVLIFLSVPALSPVYAESQAEKETRLRAELAQVEKEQAETEKILAEAKGQSASLARDILILDTKIKAAQLNIKAKNLKIETLGKDIVKKQEKINDLESHIVRGRETLAQIMRKTNETDSVTMAEFILAREDLTELFSDIDAFESVQQALKLTFQEIRQNKNQTEGEKEGLHKRKNQELDARAIIESEKRNIENVEKQKKALLKASKGNEQAYSQVLASKRAQAASIRAALFSLAGGTDAIPFGTALKYAQEAQKATGIRPAFLLAIFAQESGLTTDATFGKNVGSCYLTDTLTGAGASVKSGNVFANVMKPTRDVEPFISITKSLGLDYTKTLVSCPIASAGGYGGAMGPAQFIPSTWALFINKIKTALGVAVPNPWNPEHAFVAASFLLYDNGARAGSYTSEKDAACRYYSGRVCSASVNGNQYGVQVMAKADNIQRTMIDPLQGL